MKLNSRNGWLEKSGALHKHIYGSFNEGNSLDNTASNDRMINE
jgi:hypothetical protein